MAYWRTLTLLTHSLDMPVAVQRWWSMSTQS